MKKVSVVLIAVLMLIGCVCYNNPGGGGGGLVNGINEAWLSSDEDPGLIFRSNGDLLFVQKLEGVWYSFSGLTYTANENTITLYSCGVLEDNANYSISGNTLTINSMTFTRTRGLKIVYSGSTCREIDDGKSDNPFDPNSPNFGLIYGEDGGDYSEQLRECLTSYPNASESELIDCIMSMCDKTNPKVQLLGDKTVTIMYNTPQGRMEFERLMGRSASVFFGIIQYEGGVGINIKAELHVPGSYMPLANQNIPASEGEYVIRYTVTKPVCDGITPTDMVDRNVIFKESIEADTVSPVITIHTVAGSIDQVISVGSNYVDAGASASAGGIMSEPISNVDTSRPGNYTVVYRACKTLIYGDGRPNKDVCVTATRNVKVE
jgi:hypothetical protein